MIDLLVEIFIVVAIVGCVLWLMEWDMPQVKPLRCLLFGINTVIACYLIGWEFDQVIDLLALRHNADL